MTPEERAEARRKRREELGILDPADLEERKRQEREERRRINEEVAASEFIVSDEQLSQQRRELTEQRRQADEERRKMLEVEEKKLQIQQVREMADLLLASQYSSIAGYDPYSTTGGKEEGRS